MKPDWKKNIIVFLSSQTVSLFGTSLVQYAIVWYITLKTQSGAMITASIICGFLPMFFLSPFAGVWADRYNRKTLIILSDSAIAFATLIAAVLFFMGLKAVWLLFLVSAVRAAGSGVQTPAIGAILPQFVPQDKLTKVNGINTTIQSVIMLVSPMVSGALLTFTSIELIFFIDVGTAAIAVFALLFFLDVPPHEKAVQKQKMQYFADMRLGFSYIKNHKFIKKLFLYFAVFFFLISPVAFLTPLQVARSFGGDVWRLTAIEIAFSLGMIAGGLLMTSWGGFKNKAHTMLLGTAVIGVSTVALGIIPVFWVYLIFMGVSGISVPLFQTPSTVLLQVKVEENYLGRIFGVMGMISSSVMPLGMLIFGPMSDAVKIEWMLLGTGIMIIIQSIMLVSDRTLLEAKAGGRKYIS